MKFIQVGDDLVNLDLVTKIEFSSKSNNDGDNSGLFRVNFYFNNNPLDIANVNPVGINFFDTDAFDKFKVKLYNNIDVIKK